jgi:hypothetical protein
MVFFKNLILIFVLKCFLFLNDGCKPIKIHHDFLMLKVAATARTPTWGGGVRLAVFLSGSERREGRWPPATVEDVDTSSNDLLNSVADPSVLIRIRPFNFKRIRLFDTDPDPYRF